MYVTKVGTKGGKDGKGRTKLWVARDRMDGVKRYFKTEKEAEEFKEDYNSNKRRRTYNLPPTNAALKKTSVRTIIRSYMYIDPEIKVYSEASNEAISKKQIV